MIDLQKEMNKHLIANHEEISMFMKQQNIMFLPIIDIKVNDNNIMPVQVEDKTTIDDEEQEEQKKIDDKRKNEHRDPINGSVIHSVDFI